MRHLLTDPTNPFTRAPLAADALQPLPELRARIQAFRAGAKAGGARAAAASGGASAMDTGA